MSAPGRLLRRVRARVVAAGSRRDQGSAAAEFAMVSALLVVLFLAAFQLGFALYVRNSLTAYAQEGARYGARADSSPGEGAGRTRALISDGLSPRFAKDVDATEVIEGGARVVRVTVHAQLPLLGPFGLDDSLTVTGRAYTEGQD